LVAAKELATEPHNCLVVEDSPAGVTAARAAGMQVVALADRNISKRAFIAATRIVYGYAELNLED
jgi:beta-phosphoglucomutase-like phosphatase (HAD superfamily)